VSPEQFASLVAALDAWARWRRAVVEEQDQRSRDQVLSSAARRHLRRARAHAHTSGRSPQLRSRVERARQEWIERSRQLHPRSDEPPPR
jgi:hypothetical protein